MHSTRGNKRTARISTGGKPPKKRITIREPLIPRDERHPKGSVVEGVELCEHQETMDSARKTMLVECARRGITQNTEGDLIWLGCISWVASTIYDIYIPKMPKNEKIADLWEGVCRDMIEWERSTVDRNFKAVPEGPLIMGDDSLPTDSSEIEEYPLFVDALVMFWSKWAERMVAVRSAKGKDNLGLLIACQERVSNWANEARGRKEKVREQQGFVCPWS